MIQPKYLGLFADRESINQEFFPFKEGQQLTVPEEVLIAWYEYEYYSGQAVVLYRQDNKLYLVNGGHCSCNGLEGQWEPDEVTVPQLRMFLDKGTYFDQVKTEATEIIEALERGE